MLKIIRKYWNKYQAMRLRKAEDVIRDLKIRYHTFRILLINNEHALKILNEIDLRLKRKNPLSQDVANQADELIGVCYELVDGLNRLSGNRYMRLFDLHKHLGETIRHAFPTATPVSAQGPYCVFLDEVMPEMKKKVGGKAYPLSDLKKIFMPVPDGFVITVDACREFLRANDIERPVRQLLRKLESDDRFLRDLEAVAGEIRDLIFSAEMPADLERTLRTAYERLTGPQNLAISVRSSACVEDQTSHSFAGQFTTVLNVTSFTGLMDAFKEVLASNFNARSMVYRFHAGLPLTDFDMAVLCQIIVNARTAGVLFTMDPAGRDGGRMLVSAVAGMGSLAVGGEVPSDLYHPSRVEKEPEIPAEIAEKSYKEVCSQGGGVHTEEIKAEDRLNPLLTRAEVYRLVDLGLIIESLTGSPQDIEWAIADDGAAYILQSRPFKPSARPGARGVRSSGVSEEDILLKGGVASSAGRSIGKVRMIQSTRDLEGLGEGQVIAVLHQSLVEAARYMNCFSGLVVDKGNPADHLSNLAREYGIPMLTRTEKATQVLSNDQWIVIDADRSLLLKAPQDAMHGLPETRPVKPLHHAPEATPADQLRIGILRDIIARLNLTDAYGSSFSIKECRSLHDVIRYIHEMAIMTMFNAGDQVLEEAGSFVHRLDGAINFHFLIIDMGGGLTPGKHSLKIQPDELLSSPLLALWKGAMTPGLRWNAPPPAQSLSGLFSRGITDSGSARPIGNCNYALIARDYLNLNARLEFHFTMIDAVCGRNPKDNYIRFRFKGGGTTQIQRERRAVFIAQVLEHHDFFTDRRGDLVTGTIMEMVQSAVEERLVMLGRLLGFSRLMDSMMHNDESPGLLAKAFFEGNYTLEGFDCSSASK
ncbi:MAG: PEP/pyruvate-binding domain-containing protein [Desulfobacteraceae bacterium]